MPHRVGVAVLFLIGVLACEQTALRTVGPLNPKPVVRISPPPPPVADAGMGALSSVAQFVIAAIQDPTIRRELSQALKADSEGVGIDFGGLCDRCGG